MGTPTKKTNVLENLQFEGFSQLIRKTHYRQ